MDDQPLYSLTTMTGQESSSTRTVVVGVVELPWRVVVILVAAFAVGLPVAVLLWLVIGVWALALLLGWLAAAVWLFQGRTSNLEIRNYAALLNRRSAVLGRFMLGPAIVTVPHDDWRIVRPGSRDNPAVRVLPDQAAAAARAATPASTVATIFDSPPSKRQTRS